MSIWESVYVKLCGNKKRIAYYRKKGLMIGFGCHISGNVHFGSEPYLIKIGNNVRITEHVQFVNHDGGMWVVRNYNNEYSNCDIIKPIIVGDNVHIGIGTTIMPGCKIGNNVIIGCSAVVTHDVPDNCIVAGVPARIIRSLDEYIDKNKNSFINCKSMNSEKKKHFLVQLYNLE